MSKKKIKFLEKELENLEENLTGFKTNQFYLEYKQEREKKYDKKTNGIKIRSKCKYYGNRGEVDKVFSKS